MITRDNLELYAKKLMFEMNDDEYKTLENEFDVILKQMDLIGKIEDIDDVSPMTFPFEMPASLVENKLKILIIYFHGNKFFVVIKDVHDCTFIS